MLVSFQNPGLIDLRAIQFMGVSAKDSNNAIGYFGTGLKYAIAILLRNNHQIKIWRGRDLYEFSVRSETIRGKDFNLIYMNDSPLGITTDLGKNWEMWQAFRELYSNCLDEKGIANSGEHLSPTDNTTLIEVIGSEFSEQWRERNNIFLLGRVPRSISGGVEIHEGRGDWIYYRGVRVLNLLHPTKFTYNIIEQAEITEDRTLPVWEADTHLSNAIVQSTDTDFLREVLTTTDMFHEHNVTLSVCYEPSDVFMGVSAKEFPDLYPCARRKYLKHAPDVKKYETYHPNQIELSMIAKGVAFCASIGFPIDYPIETVVSLGAHNLALAEKGTIYLSQQLFGGGTKKVAHALLEEQIHLKFKYADCTRALQTFLFEKIVSMGEEKMGQPL